MAVRTTPRIFQAMTRPVLALRAGSGECHLDITPKELQIRTPAESYEAYLDYTIPTTTSDLTVTNTRGSYCVEFDNLKSLFTEHLDESVIIRVPEETANGAFAFQSGTFRYRRAPLSPNTADRVFDDISAEPTTKITIPNSVFQRAIEAGNLIGPSLTVCVHPDTNQIEFSSDGTKCGDSFIYTEPVDKIHSEHPKSTELTVSIDRLIDITPQIPASKNISLELTPEHLAYRAEHPVPGASLTLYAAKYKRGIHG
jgi:hypothetical protein